MHMEGFSKTAERLFYIVLGKEKKGGTESDLQYLWEKR